ncbi:MAG: alpha/beta hydrolase [Candidatus Saccharibacteria bacterium]
MIKSTEATWITHTSLNGTVIGGFESNSQKQTAPLVLIPGIGGKVSSLKLTARALHDRGLTATSFDTSEAHGKLGSAKTMSEYGRLLIEAVDEEWDDGRPIDVIGHSWGGILAQEIAVTYPDRVRKLGLLSTLPGGVPYSTISPSVMLAMMRPGRSLERLREIGSKLYGGDFRDNPDLIESLEIAHEVDAGSYRRQNGAAFLSAWSSLANQIKHIKADTLVMGGSDDPITPFRNSEILHGRIADSHLVRVEAGGHMFAMSRADYTADIIDAFIGHALVGDSFGGVA